jgi:hypothetical protein
VERDLIISGAAREGSVEDLSQLMDFVPGNDAFFDWIENPGLAFLLDRLTAIRNDEIRAPDCLVVVLAASVREPSALDQGAIGARRRSRDAALARSMRPRTPACWSWSRRSQRRSSQ